MPALHIGFALALMLSNAALAADALAQWDAIAAVRPSCTVVWQIVDADGSASQQYRLVADDDRYRYDRWTLRADGTRDHLATLLWNGLQSFLVDSQRDLVVISAEQQRHGWPMPPLFDFCAPAFAVPDPAPGDSAAPPFLVPADVERQNLRELLQLRLQSLNDATPQHIDRELIDGSSLHVTIEGDDDWSATLVADAEQADGTNPWLWRMRGKDRRTIVLDKGAIQIHWLMTISNPTDISLALPTTQQRRVLSCAVGMEVDEDLFFLDTMSYGTIYDRDADAILAEPGR